MNVYYVKQTYVTEDYRIIEKGSLFYIKDYWEDVPRPLEFKERTWGWDREQFNEYFEKVTIGDITGYKE